MAFMNFGTIRVVGNWGEAHSSTEGWRFPTYILSLNSGEGSGWEDDSRRDESPSALREGYERCPCEESTTWIADTGDAPVMK